MLAIATALAVLSFSPQQTNADPVGEALIQCAPVSLEAAMKCLDEHWPAKEEFRAVPYDDISGGHFGIGMWMRNNWQLWGGGPLAKHFNDQGIQHPDDMSGIILESYWLRLHDCPLRLNDQIAYYQGFWARSERDEDMYDYMSSEPNLDCTTRTGAPAQ